MTLILTEMSSHGIAMAADSALISEGHQGINVENDAVKKLYSVKHLRAAVSCWGVAQIGIDRTDGFIKMFLDDEAPNCDSLDEFARKLAVKVRDAGAASESGNATRGFHVAGIVEYDGKSVPTFYHVADGPSEVLAKRGMYVDPHRVNANHEEPPAVVLGKLMNNEFISYRNGDYRKYAVVSDALKELSRHFRDELHVEIPYINDLSHRVDYLAFQIRTMAELYRMSNIYPGIGGRVDTLTINLEGGITEHSLQNPTPLPATMRPRTIERTPPFQSGVVGTSSASMSPPPSGTTGGS